MLPGTDVTESKSGLFPGLSNTIRPWITLPLKKKKDWTTNSALTVQSKRVQRKRRVS